MEPELKYRNRQQFFIVNLLRGLAFMALLVAAFIYFKRNFDVSTLSWLEPLYTRPRLMFLIYIISEVMFGIIPPELFMIWATTYESLNTYLWILLALTSISYAAGWLAYFVGLRFRYSVWYRFLKRKYLKKYELYLQEYGAFLIIVAGVTPLPFAAICLLVGSVNYPVKKFFLYSISRIVRFVFYAIIIWEAHYF
jgi:membrane protein YqaA with SNARE-associated domain